MPDERNGQGAASFSQAVGSVGSERSKDVLSPVARTRHEFLVGSLDDQPREGDDLAEALVDNTRSAIPDQAAFRIDFPAVAAAIGREESPGDERPHGGGDHGRCGGAVWAVAGAGEPDAPGIRRQLAFVP